ncbi:MAG: hypothetical protein KJ703_06750 [Alphaproteobacteria bacterium]|nr:hypothetical protein [Alphaproteobacteria bacterium]
MNEKPLTLRQAAAAGLFFALGMSAWRYFADSGSFDQTAIRFAIYFCVFTLGFWSLYNLLTRRRAKP